MSDLFRDLGRDGRLKYYGIIACCVITAVILPFLPGVWFSLVWFYALPILLIISVFCIVRIVGLSRRSDLVVSTALAETSTPGVKLPFRRQLSVITGLNIVSGVLALLMLTAWLSSIDGNTAFLWTFIVSVVIFAVGLVLVFILKSRQRAVLIKTLSANTDGEQVAPAGGTLIPTDNEKAKVKDDPALKMGIVTSVSGVVFLAYNGSFLHSLTPTSGNGILIILMLPFYLAAFVLQIVAIVGLYRAGQSRRRKLATVLNLVGLLSLAGGLIVSLLFLSQWG